MNIVMHCGGLPFNGETIETKSLGGSESAAFYMARELASLGHDVKLFTNHPEGGMFNGVEYIYSGPATQQAPLGTHFEFYARQCPHDILVIQRSANAFNKPFASKVNILWLHDLALIRQKAEFMQQMWNVDAVLTVSQYHKDQVCSIYDINPDIVYPVLNGVDPELFSDYTDRTNPVSRWDEIPRNKDLRMDADEQGNYFHLKKNIAYLMYSSRPERGLEHLVRPGGIMERLQTECPNVHLLVCGYDNTTDQMREYYEQLWHNCDLMPNVTRLGSLTKANLAQLMKHCFLHVYPTEFEEVSCITAMEAFMAKLPFISSNHAALPETCKGGGAVLLDLKDGRADEDKFVSVISQMERAGVAKIDDKSFDYSKLVKLQIGKALDYLWERTVLVFEDALKDVFFRPQNPSTVAKHLFSRSDVVVYDTSRAGGQDSIGFALEKEYNECYRFYLDDSFADHYLKYYQYEKDRGVDYGPENLEGNLRYMSVANIVGSLPSGSYILDYGCAHGHYTVNLAKRFPSLHFVGVDIAQSNIDKARAWAKEEGIQNCEFFHKEAHQLTTTLGEVDCILACEVLEHVADPTQLISDLIDTGHEDTVMVITTPFGPWESQGYQEHWPWRAHLYEFERDDLEGMFGHMDEYKITVAPGGFAKGGEPLGSYVVSFKLGTSDIEPYAKLAHVIPRRQTLTLAMIAKDAQYDIERCLLSALPIIDEVIIGIDENTGDRTRERAVDVLNKQHGLPYSFVTIQSPTEIGFDEARNQVIERAAGDWIMWLDSDEELHNPDGLIPYLRNSQVNGIALEQHHISADPPGIIKTDHPCKIFRNRKGIKFYGVVHEHPEMIYGEAVPYTISISGTSIMHYGYPDEKARRGRFQRNLELLVRDREKYPDRSLGKFLWIRDLAQMSSYEMEKTGKVSQAMLDRSEEGVRLWVDLLHENIRMAVDALPYYSACVRLLGKGFEMSISLDTNLVQGNANAKQIVPVEARFLNEDHAKMLQDLILHERVKDYDSKYF